MLSRKKYYVPSDKWKYIKSQKIENTQVKYKYFKL